MTTSPSLRDLPAEDLQEFMTLLRTKLEATKRELADVDKQVSTLLDRKGVLTSKVQQYERFFPVESSIVAEANVVEAAPAITIIATRAFSSPPSYEMAAGQYEKLRYIIDRPWKYNRRSFVGAKPVVAAVRIEDPEQRDEPEEILMRRVGPALSRMAKEGKLIKMAERKHPLRVHYLSPDWFEAGELKTQYKEQLSCFDLVPVMPRQQASDQELPLPPQSQPAQVLTDEEAKPTNSLDPIDMEIETTSPLEAEDYGF
jgi:hypothetical protein